MEFLHKIISASAPYKTLKSDVKNGHLPVGASGLSGIHKAALVSGLAVDIKQKILLITRDEASATEISNDLNALGTVSAVFPVKDFCFKDMLGRSNEYEQRRLNTLSKVFDGDLHVLVCPVAAAVQYTVPPEILKQNTVTLSVGMQIELQELKIKLLAAGYENSAQVEGAGQFSVRGGIVDVFPVSAESPVRIEFWGDEIDSLSSFDIISQRRTDILKSIKIPQASEIICDNELLASKLEKLLKSGNLNDSARKTIERDIALLSSNIKIPTDRYINEIYRPCTVFDYMENALVVVAESNDTEEHLKTAQERTVMDIPSLIEEGLVYSKNQFELSFTEYLSKIENAVFLENFARGNYNRPVRDIVNFNYKRISPWKGEISVLLQDTEFLLQRGGRCAVLVSGEKAATVLYEALKRRGITTFYHENIPDTIEKGITVINSALSAGIEIPEQKFMLISGNYIHADRKVKRIKPSESAFSSLDELKMGDYVVHVSHGIGIFAGIKKITTGLVTKDYIKINYAKTDVLYVPVTQLDLISKYIGSAESGTVKLNKLGSSDWQKTRARVKHAVKNMAKELTALYAKRMSVKGYAFSPDTELQREFESTFPYTETEDQLKCLKEIKRDMERPVPMDRLLCGDVGFGKTEVALRAAFKCISEGKQCVFLVPTTILALQHYNTTRARFGELPLNVKMLSRFVSPSEQKKIISGLKTGKIDMVIGTHRIISKDISFKNLGLVIIDEEQRFGVAQKEKLKQDYPDVDVLTLSATPIPRTLNMALSGLRDMSSIEEAPSDRLPIQSYVLEYNKGVIIDAINKEIRRSGQVYYLHNKVESIYACAAKLKENLPDARIEVAHGQMSEELLSRVWRRLLEHEIDILVCTTIIETGVDAPNVNTLIVEDADRFGLSQLHQLRGRVGRSPRRAYAYFCYKPSKQLSEVSENRLEAIREYTEFGAGFKIAMRDLEIRGAGSILGGEQHGNLEAVGYDMYIKLLNDAINEEKGITTETAAECMVDLNVSAHIPERYIESLPARLGIYKRIAKISDDEGRSDVIDELCDRFGEPPKAVLGLIDIALLRNKAAKLGIYEISHGKNALVLKVTQVNAEQIEKINMAFGKRAVVSAADKPYYTVSAKAGQNTAALISEIAAAL